MSLPEWVESVPGLIGKLCGVPIRVSKRAVTSASYLGISFAAAVAEVWKLGIALPLRELSDSKLQKIRSQDIADAAEAHNKAMKKRAEAEEIQSKARLNDAKAENVRAKAEKTKAEARAIDSKTALDRHERMSRLAMENRLQARDRLESAVRKLEAQGGGLYLDPPPDDDEPDYPLDVSADL